MSEHAIREYIKTRGQSSNEQLLDFFHPVGSYYETSDNSFDPNTKWGGTWVKEIPGMVHVSGGTGYPVSKANNNNGRGAKDGGEATVVLTVEEIPSHTHTSSAQGYGIAYIAGTSGTSYGVWSGTGNHGTGATGGGQAHNNMQPHINVNRWHRTA